MEIATFVSLMSEDEKKDCLKLIAADNLKLFGDVLVEAQQKEQEKIGAISEKTAAFEQKTAATEPKAVKRDGFLGYSDV